MLMCQEGCRTGAIAGIAAIILTAGLFAFLVLSWMSGWGAPGRPVPAPPGPGGNVPITGLSGAALRTALVALRDSFVTGGSATTTTTGAFSFSGQIAADTIASNIHGGMAWLSFIDIANPGAGEVLVVLNEPEDSVNVSQGPLAAIGQDDDCTWSIEVTESSVSGTISCAAAEVWRNTTEPTGTTASIQLQFSTTLTPMEGEEPGGGEPSGEGDGEAD